MEIVLPPEPSDFLRKDEAMFYEWLIYGALAVCVMGVAYRILGWFRRYPACGQNHGNLTGRMCEALAGAGRALGRRKILGLLRAMVLDVFLQRRLFQLEWQRWAAHSAIVAGFMVLLIMHALDDLVMFKLFRGYESTLNPYLFIRNVAGALMLAGLAFAVRRRIRYRALRQFTNRADVFILALLAAAALSGFLLEASKIISRNDFNRMVEEWAFVDDRTELDALEAYWVKEMGLTPARVRPLPDAEIPALGREVHEMNCMGCHADPEWAFASYAISRVIRPVGLFLDGAGLPVILWWVHVLSALAGLAFLPFTKMFHVIATPLSLLANAVADRVRPAPSRSATLQMMELDACTHCGACTGICSVGVCYEILPNESILPSEKIGELRRMARGEAFSTGRRKRLQEGLYICTNCTRCTEVCPSGIDLQELWRHTREALLGSGSSEPLVFSPLSFYPSLAGERGHRESLEASTGALFERWRDAYTSGPLTAQGGTRQGISGALKRSAEGRTFSSCYNCSTCTNSCPVVAAYERPVESLGLLPHQIMHAAGLGLKDLSLNCGMLWYCLGCYNCQEHCPQGVRVTDVIYELKNIAMKSDPWWSGTQEDDS